MRLFPAGLNLSFDEAFKTRLPEAYERLLMDVARGNQTLFMRSDEVEAAWAFIDPIVNEAKLRQPEKYTAGTWGPVSSFELMAEHGHRWIERGGWMSLAQAITRALSETIAERVLRVLRLWWTKCH